MKWPATPILDTPTLRLLDGEAPSCSTPTPALDESGLFGTPQSGVDSPTGGLFDDEGPIEVAEATPMSPPPHVRFKPDSPPTPRPEDEPMDEPRDEPMDEPPAEAYARLNADDDDDVVIDEARSTPPKPATVTSARSPLIDISNTLTPPMPTPTPTTPSPSPVARRTRSTAVATDGWVLVPNSRGRPVRARRGYAAKTPALRCRRGGVNCGSCRGCNELRRLMLTKGSVGSCSGDCGQCDSCRCNALI